MNHQYFIYTICFLIVLFLIYFNRTFNWPMLKAIWQNAQLKVATQEHIDQAMKKGQTAFAFENGKVIIYAKSQLGAMLKYKQSQFRKNVSTRKTIKKV